MQAIVLCGGKGTRLRPLTDQTPKCLLPLGETPLLDLILTQLRGCGVQKVTLALGAHGGQIRAFCGDGSRWDLALEYFTETFPLGTAGALVSLRDEIHEPCLVMNADVLWTPEINRLMARHRRENNAVTIATWEQVLRIGYGVVHSDANGMARDYVEKPEVRLPISAGIYAVSPRALRGFEPNRRIDFPELVKRLLEQKAPVGTHALSGSWIDIGTPEDLERARSEWGTAPGRYTVHFRNTATRATPFR